MGYKAQITSLILFLFIINIVSLLFYVSDTHNDLAFVFITFINPFLSSLIIYWKLKNPFVIKKLCYFLLANFFCYLIILLILNYSKSIILGYEIDTVFFVLECLSILSIIFVFIDLLKQKQS
jgi:hypothetical protein